MPPLTALAYARPTTRVGPPPPKPLPAVLMCIPGLICWLTFLGLFGPRVIGRPIRSMNILDSSFPGFILLCWGAAIITGIASLACYLFRKRKPWYVWINLLINIPGLLFTAGIVTLIVWALNRR